MGENYVWFKVFERLFNQPRRGEKVPETGGGEQAWPAARQILEFALVRDNWHAGKPAQRGGRSSMIYVPMRENDRGQPASVQAFDDKNRRWFFSGQGRSGLVAQMAAMRFMHLGYEAHFVGEATAPSVRKGDGFILICGSGKTPISMDFAQVAHSQRALIVVLTHKPESKIVGLADIVLTVPMEDTAQFGGSLFEQCCLILLDSVALEITRSRPDAHDLMWERHTNMQ